MRHLPNLLTGMRLALALFMFVALAAAAGDVPWLSDMLTTPMQQSLQRWAFGAFAVAAITDFFDGYIARRQGLVSVLGQFLDPLADKLIVMATLVWLVKMGRVETWVVVLLLSRELSITGLRSIASTEGHVFASGVPGSGWVYQRH